MRKAAGRCPAWLSAALLAALAHPAFGQTEHRFDISLLGLRAAMLTISADEGAGRYSLTGRLDSTGVLALARRVRYEAATAGRLRDGRYSPEAYQEKTDTGTRQSAAAMTYVGGVPQLAAASPPRPARDEAIDPATQGGTVDPLTALYAALRDVTPGQACDLRLVVFDGRRRSQVTLGTPVPEGDGLRCTGEYRRLAGFSARDMRQRSRFPFTLRLAPTPDGRLRVVEVEVETLYGSAFLRRP